MQQAEKEVRENLRDVMFTMVESLDGSLHKPQEWKDALMRIYLLSMGEYHCPETALGKEDPMEFPSSRVNASEDNRKLTKRRRMANIELN
jgi:hypothetical protein